MNKIVIGHNIKKIKIYHSNKGLILQKDIDIYFPKVIDHKSIYQNYHILRSGGWWGLGATEKSGKGRNENAFHNISQGHTWGTENVNSKTKLVGFTHNFFRRHWPIHALSLGRRRCHVSWKIVLSRKRIFLMRRLIHCQHSPVTVSIRNRYNKHKQTRIYINRKKWLINIIEVDYWKCNSKRPC